VIREHDHDNSGTRQVCGSVPSMHWREKEEEDEEEEEEEKEKEEDNYSEFLFVVVVRTWWAVTLY
jgi:hypothetical protein